MAIGTNRDHKVKPRFTGTGGPDELADVKLQGISCELENMVIREIFLLTYWQKVNFICESCNLVEGCAITLNKAPSPLIALS